MCEELYLGDIMKQWYFSGNVKLKLLITLSGCLSAVIIQPGWAEEKLGSKERVETSQLPQVSEIEFPVTNAQMLVQSPSPANSPSVPLDQENQVVTITGVKANPTDKGLEVVLQTTKGEQLQVTNRSTGNNFIADISGGQLRLPSGEAFAFRSEKPLSGITEIKVTNIDANTVRVTVVGEASLPTVELFDDDAGLVFGVMPAATATQAQPEASQTTEKPATEALQEKPAAQQDDPIELVVTGERDGYRVLNVTAGTRTDTPLRDIPQSIQIIPQEVLRDQRADVSSALRNTPSVRNAAPSSFGSPRVQVRGFFSSPTLDGFVSRVPNGADIAIGSDLTGIERIEVLQGPNSVLFGSTSPGGTVNFVTKQPLRESYYFAEATVGSLSSYRGEVDLSGPLDAERRVLYRLNTSYGEQGFRPDSSQSKNFVIAPAISFALGKNTNLSIEGVYKDLLIENGTNGLPASGTILPNPNGKVPLSRNLTQNTEDVTQTRISYKLEHKFNENWSLSNAFRYGATDFDYFGRFAGALEPDNRTLPTRFDEGLDQYRDYRMATNVVGKFSTGSIKHQLLLGVDLGRQDSRFTFTEKEAAAIDLFNPIFGQAPGAITFEDRSNTVIDELGILVQNQLTITDNLKLLLSGRFDTFNQINRDNIANTETSQSGNAFSPRFGIVYQPISPISLYANYSQSFEPVIGRSRDGSNFKPTRGTQYEIGVKADLNDRLSTTLALYDITRSNVQTEDPVNRRFRVQTGEQRSQGVELSLAGEILPGWNIFASYAYNDARTTRDNNFTIVGKRLSRTSPHAASLWTTYEIQRGGLQGLGFGLGLFYVGERAGDNANTFEVPSYLTTDAAIFYKRDRLRAAINIKNLFNVEYFEGSFNRNRVFPGAPLTVEGTVSWTF